jgi:hypothetical protein
MTNEQEIADSKWNRYIEERKKYGLEYTAQEAYMRGYDDGRSAKNVNLQIADWLLELHKEHGDELFHLAMIAHQIKLFDNAVRSKGEQGYDEANRFLRWKKEMADRKEK